MDSGKVLSMDPKVVEAMLTNMNRVMGQVYEAMSPSDLDWERETDHYAEELKLERRADRERL